MPEVFVGAGSNIEPRKHLGAGLRALAEHFGLLRLSPVYRNSAVGFEGEDFLNLVIAFETEAPVGEVAAVLAGIEADNGRTRGEAKFAPRSLDLDLLLYGDRVVDEEGLEIPHPRMAERAFVVVPLLELDSGLVDPRTGEPYAEMDAATPSPNDMDRIMDGEELLDGNEA